MEKLYKNNNYDAEARVCRLVELGTYGGNLLEYLKDVGINEIIIYGVDYFALLVYVQARAMKIEITDFITDNEFEIDSPIDKNKLSFVHYAKISKSKHPILICCNGAYFPWKESANITSGYVYAWEYLHNYSLMKHILLPSLNSILKKNIKIVLVRIPSIWDIRSKSDYEKKYNAVPDKEKTLFVFNNVLYPYMDSFNQYSEIIKEYRNLKIIEKNGVKFAEDYKGNYVNFANGNRLVTGTPEIVNSYVHVYGNSAVNGWCTEDKYTVSSFMQKELNVLNLGHEVLNNVCGDGLNYPDIAKRIRYDNIKSGDTVVIIHHHFSPYFFNQYKDIFIPLDLVPVFQRPNNFGEIFIQSQHYSPNAHEIIAKKIVEKIILTQHNTTQHNTTQHSI